MWNEQLVFSLDGGGTVTVTNANIWQGGLTIEQSVSSDGFFEIGSTHVGQMKVTLVDTFEDIDFQNAAVVVSMAKDSDTLQQIGIYTVVRSERDNGILGITAYDNMTLLSEPYTTALSFPSTYGAMVQEITGRTIQFDGSTTAVQTAPEFEPDTTKREVLGYIAQACGYNVKCNSSGYIEFVRYNMSGFNTSGAYHEISSLFDFHHSHYPVVITGAKVVVRTIVSTTDPDTGETTTEEVVTTYTSGTDDYQIVIEGNPLITTANGQAVANTIFATFGGVEFYTGSVTHLSSLSIKASDIMKVTDRTGTTYPMLVSSTQISTGSAQLSQSFAEEPASKLSVQPSIIDRVQTSVRQALLDAQNSMNKASYASQIAGNTNQYFWHTETGSDTGAHITEISRGDFLADPENGGGNTLIRSNGVAIRDGLTELAQFSTDGVKVYDGESAYPLAQFGSSGVKVGGDGKSMIEMANDGMYAMTESGVDAFRIVSGGYSGTKTISTKTDLSNPDDDKRWRWSPATVVAPEQTPVSNTTETMEATVHIRIFYNDSDIVDKYVKYSFDKTYNPSGSSTPVSKTSEQTITINSSTFIKLEFNGYVRETVKGVYVNRISVTSRPANVTKVLIFSLQLLDRITVMNPVLPSYTFGTRLGNTGAYSFTEGDDVTASGYASHAEGIQTTASGRASHAEGRGTTASGEASSISGASVIAPSHAEGYQTNATSGAAHAEGQGTTASGDASHSEGYRTTASGAGAHAEGIWTEASGKASHASGYGTKASSDYQTAIGQYNVEDVNDEYALIIGNGTDDSNRSNAFTVDWDGFVMAKPKAFTPTWESGQAPANSHCVVSAGLCSLFYQGTGGVHSNQTLLGTLPVGARPKNLVFCPCVKGANAYGMVQIDTDGKIYLGYISSASVTARLYFNCSFPVV